MVDLRASDGADGEEELAAANTKYDQLSIHSFIECAARLPSADYIRLTGPKLTSN